MATVAPSHSQNWFSRVFGFSIGRKLLMALTGLFLVTFLMVHVSGNFLLFMNDEGKAFNEYSHHLTSNLFIMVVEIGLFLGIILHVVDGTILYIKNRKARGGERYRKVAHGRSSLWSSRNMALSGVILLAFLVIHLKTFFVPYRITKDVEASYVSQESLYTKIEGETETNINLYQLTRDAFYNPAYSIFYVISMVLLGLHLHHGFTSAFQTLGLRHPKYYGAIKIIGIVLTIIISGGFAAMPLYFLFERLTNSGMPA